MRSLQRDSLVRLFKIGDKNYEVRDRQDNIIVDSDKDYFIYMKDVNFKNGAIIDGIYLGNLESNSPILDNSCKYVSVQNGQYTIDSKQVKTARMVAVNNKTNVIVVIQQD